MVMAVVVVGKQYCGESERELTVRKTSLFYPGDGYAAYDHHTGELVFRVDTYGRGPSSTHLSSHSLIASADNLVLMDPSGHAILTVRRKWPSLHQRWEGFLGESIEGQKPVFTVRRSSIFGIGSGISVEVHADSRADYRIQGSFAHRCCRLLMYPTPLTTTTPPDADADADADAAAAAAAAKDDDDINNDVEVIVVAEIKRKVDASTNVVLGKDVFCLCLGPGFDAAFAMGLVLVLDQICSGNANANANANGDRDDDDIHSTAEPSTAHLPHT